jgi:hypothetical protein
MDEIDFEVMRLRYIAALDAYHVQAARLAKHCSNFGQPQRDELRDEEQSLYHLAKTRREMLDALTALQHRR